MIKIECKRVVCLFLLLFIWSISYSQTKTWSQYNIKNSFTVDIPSSLELRKDNQAYSEMMSAANININTNSVVFQQSGLGDLSTLKSPHYCRIIIEITPGSYGDYAGAYETIYLDSDLQSVLNQLANSVAYPWTPQNVKHSNTVVNGYKAIKTTYTRKSPSQGDMTMVRIYILQNKDEMVKIIFSYKKSDEPLYLEDLNKVIRSFKWMSVKK